MGSYWDIFSGPSAGCTGFSWLTRHIASHKHTHTHTHTHSHTHTHRLISYQTSMISCIYILYTIYHVSNHLLTWKPESIIGLRMFAGSRQARQAERRRAWNGGREGSHDGMTAWRYDAMTPWHTPTVWWTMMRYEWSIDYMRRCSMAHTGLWW
jgi:hypothetical protein